MVTLAVIPARQGSKGLPGKNLRAVGGRSLVARAIDVARAVPAIDDVLVSSDGPDILAEALACGAMAIERPADLARDTTPTLHVLLYLLRLRPEVERLVVLQPTSPLRNARDVENCLERLVEAPTCVTVTAAAHPLSWTFELGPGDRMQPLGSWDRFASRRQDGRSVFQLNGAAYAARAAHLRGGGALVGPETVAIVMPKERSIDVDDEFDLVMARALATHVEGPDE